MKHDLGFNFKIIIADESYHPLDLRDFSISVALEIQEGDQT